MVRVGDKIRLKETTLNTWGEVVFCEGEVVTITHLSPRLIVLTESGGISRHIPNNVEWEKIDG